MDTAVVFYLFTSRYLHRVALLCSSFEVHWNELHVNSGGAKGVLQFLLDHLVIRQQKQRDPLCSISSAHPGAWGSAPDLFEDNNAPLFLHDIAIHKVKQNSDKHSGEVIRIMAVLEWKLK